MNGKLLSTQVSKCRALAAGGASVNEILEILKSWFIQHASSARAGTRARGDGRRHQRRLSYWGDVLIQTLDETKSLGVALGQLLQEMQGFIRREERLLRRIKAVEVQFGFQAAIALVLPWVVMAFQQAWTWNIFIVAGISFQLISVVAFYLLLNSVFRKSKTAQTWIFDFLIGVWMRVSTGLPLLSALNGAYAQMEAINVAATREQKILSDAWKRWVHFRSQSVRIDTDTANLSFRMDDTSGLVSDTLDALLRQGAPARGILLELLVQIDDERQFELEEQVASLPVRLSLIFCFCLTPALFLILLGGVWPQIEALGL